MFEEQEIQLKQDGRNNGTEIGNKIYELWFNVAKQHAKLTLKGGAKEMVDTTKEAISFLMRVNESNVYMGQDFEATGGQTIQGRSFLFNFHGCSSWDSFSPSPVKVGPRTFEFFFLPRLGLA